LKVGAAIAAAGAVIMAIGGAIMGIGFTLSALGSIIIAAKVAFGLLLSPIGLIAAALVAGVAAWLMWTESGQKALDTLGGGLAALGNWAMEVFGAIGAALASGNLKAAADVAWAALKVAWQTGMDWLLTHWENLQFSIRKAMAESLNGVQVLWQTWVFTLQKLIVNFTAWVMKKFSGMWDSIRPIIQAQVQAMSYFTGQDAGKIMKGMDLVMRDPKMLEAGRRGLMGALQAKHDSRLAALGNNLDGMIDALEDARDGARKDRRASLIAARRQLEAAKFTAHQGKQLNYAGVPAGGGDTGGIPMPTPAVGGSPFTLGPTFSAAAAVASGYGGAGAFERLASDMAATRKATEKTATATETTAERTKRVFDAFDRFAETHRHR